MKRARNILWSAVFLACLLPAGAFARTDARCGLSTGIVAGPTIPTDLDLKDEFKALYHVEADAKYYLYSIFSGSLSLGYEYGRGAPKHFIYKNESTTLDGRGISFWRAMPFWGTLRIEPLKHYTFSPYVGGAYGGKYLVLDRRGYERQISITDSGDEWLLGYAVIAGMDAMLSDFVFFRLEGRYQSARSHTVEFMENKDMGGIDILAGINIYF